MRFAVSKLTATHPASLELTALWLPAIVMLATGCLQGSGQGIDPDLKAQRRQLSKETVETADLPSRAEREAEAEAAGDSEMATDEEAQTAEQEEDAPAPSNDDDPNAMEPARTPPPEASLGNDSVRCGDGVVDSDELCDIAIEPGEPGACPMSEDDCDNTDPCYPEVYVVRACWTHCEPVEPEDASCNR